MRPQPDTLSVVNMPFRTPRAPALGGSVTRMVGAGAGVQFLCAEAW